MAGNKTCYGCLFAQRVEATREWVCRHKHVGPVMARRTGSPYIAATVLKTGCMRWMAQRDVPEDSLLRELVGPGEKKLRIIAEHATKRVQDVARAAAKRQISLLD